MTARWECRSESFPRNILHCFIFILLIDDLDIQTIALKVRLLARCMGESGRCWQRPMPILMDSFIL